MSEFTLEIPGLPWNKPETPSDVLEYAAKLIEDDQRWTTGAMFSALQASEIGQCTNVAVCAVGALAYAIFDGPMLKEYKRLEDLDANEDLDIGPEDFVRNRIAESPLGQIAVIYLANVIGEDVESPYGSGSSLIDPYMISPELRETRAHTAMEVIISANDAVSDCRMSRGGYPSERQRNEILDHLEKIRGYFKIAAERAREGEAREKTSS